MFHWYEQNQTSNFNADKDKTPTSYLNADHENQTPVWDGKETILVIFEAQ